MTPLWEQRAKNIQAIVEMVLESYKSMSEEDRIGMVSSFAREIAWRYTVKQQKEWMEMMRSEAEKEARRNAEVP